MSRKRRLPDNPVQSVLDFEGLDLTEEEEISVKEALKGIQKYKEIHVKEHTKKRAVRLTFQKTLLELKDTVSQSFMYVLQYVIKDNTKMMIK